MNLEKCVKRTLQNVVQNIIEASILNDSALNFKLEILYGLLNMFPSVGKVATWHAPTLFFLPLIHLFLSLSFLSVILFFLFFSLLHSIFLPSLTVKTHAK